jgi:putative transposase
MTRERPALEVDRSLSGHRVVAVLDQLACTYGLPKTLCVDDGPEFTSRALDARFREECLNQHWFASLEEARTTIEAWRVDYNTERPHTALRHQAPAVYRVTWIQTQEALHASH